MWNIAIVITFIGTAVILAYITTKFGDKHVFLKFIFFFFTLFIFIISLNFVRSLTSQTGVVQTISIIYNVLIWITLGTMIYFGVFFVWQSLKLKKLKQKEEEGLESI